MSLSVEGTSIEAYGPRTLATAVVKQQGCTGHIPAKQQPSLAAAGRKWGLRFEVLVALRCGTSESKNFET